MKRKLSALIRDKELEILELNLRAPNIFSILKISHYELRHSDFLAWLLNPNGSHGLGDLFLKKFLKDVFSLSEDIAMDEFEIDSYNFSDIEIGREWSNIDILILSSDFIVTIENKILSNESEDQLSDYRRTVEERFPQKKKIYVFLTPFGVSPKKKDDQVAYIPVSYLVVHKCLQELLQIYADQLTDRTKIYINDYYQVLERDVLKQDKLSGIARSIYATHKEAIDFIIEQKPDLFNEVGDILDELIRAEGWILGSSRKRARRFLTGNLTDVIPRTSTSDEWQDNEAFLFEFLIAEDKLIFKTAISPGNESDRAILKRILDKVTGSKKPRGKQYLVHFQKNKKLPFGQTDLTRIREKITQEWPGYKRIVDKVEKALLAELKP